MVFLLCSGCMSFVEIEGVIRMFSMIDSVGRMVWGGDC